MSAGESSSSQATVGAKLEYFKVNLDNQDLLLKKMVRSEKKRAVKRAKRDESDGETPVERKVDKDELRERVASGAYDVSLHFSKKASLDLDLQEKITRVIHTPEASKKKQLSFYLQGTNCLHKYKGDLSADDEGGQFKLESTVGESLGCHAGPIRGVVLSNNDYLMASYSFDSVQVWRVDFHSQ